MEMQFHMSGNRARRDFREEDASTRLDVVLRLDRDGFVVHASPNADELGLDLTTLLLMPHIGDFAQADYAADVNRLLQMTKSGEVTTKWFDFPLAEAFCRDDKPMDAEEELPASRSRRRKQMSARRWFGMWLEPVDDDDGADQGFIAILRCAQHKYAMVDEIEALAATDPMTGLANRPAFCGSLARLLARDADQAENAMAIFAVDRMRAIFMQYGQTTADEIRWGFARYLETMALPEQDLALLDEERFAVLLPGMSVAAARKWAGGLLTTFKGLTAGSTSRAPELTASAGIAKVEKSVDWTLRQAEMGLVMARAGGGMQTGIGRPAPSIADGAGVEQAIQEALRRAERRAH